MPEIFTDAQLMAVRYPDTFEAPTLDDLRLIEVGDYVKICARDKERFWVLVTGIEGEVVTGEVRNVLLSTDVHGLRLGDTVVFEKRNIYQVEG